MHAMEHRWGNRLRVRKRIQLRCRHHLPVTGMLLEASLSGGFVRTSMQLNIPSRVEVDVEIGGESYTASASVVRREMGGLALEWSEFAPQAITILLGELPLISSERPLEHRVAS